MGLYIDGKKVIDDSIVNVTSPLYKTITANKTWTDLTGNDLDSNKTLISIHDNAPSTNWTLGGHGSAIAFGGANTHAAISVDWQKAQVLIAGAGNSNTPTWSEKVAWKSDIAKLKQEITELKKQIGGGAAQS